MTELEEQRIWLGNQSSQLSDAGRIQAVEFARYSWVHPTRVYAAPATHIREFGRIAFPDYEIEEVPEFTDRSMGTLTGRSYHDTLAEFPRRNWLAWQRSFYTAPPNGDSYFDISERVLTRFRTRILPVMSTDMVVLICASDVIRILIGYLTQIEEEDIPSLKVEAVVPYVINGLIESLHMV